MPDIPLQKAPLGLLGAFSLKTLGHNPANFSDAVVPTLDVYDQYLAEDIREIREELTIAIGTRTGSMSHTVPRGYAYRVLGMGCHFTLNVADIALTATVATSIQVPAAVAGIYVEPGGTMIITGATGLVRELGLWLPRPLFMPPGFSISMRVYLSANVTVATSLNSMLLAQRIEL